MSNEVDSNVTEIYEKERVTVDFRFEFETRRNFESEEDFVNMVKDFFERRINEVDGAEDVNAYFDKLFENAVKTKNPKEGDTVDTILVIDLDV